MIENACGGTEAAPKGFFVFRKLGYVENDRSGEEMILGLSWDVLGFSWSLGGARKEPGSGRRIQGGRAKSEPGRSQQEPGSSQERARRQPAGQFKDENQFEHILGPSWGHFGAKKQLQRSRVGTCSVVWGSLCIMQQAHGSVRFGFCIDGSGSCGSVAGRVWLQQGNGEARGTWGN